MLNAGQIILQQEHDIPVSFFAKEAVHSMEMMRIHTLNWNHISSCREVSLHALASRLLLRSKQILGVDLLSNNFTIGGMVLQFTSLLRKLRPRTSREMYLEDSEEYKAMLLSEVLPALVVFSSLHAECQSDNFATRA
ncbi:hypothetical protein NE237_018782 [Protea cynaroides]|uniref:Uncharacterized protein n=1 Tax=Protea cynaroides TaxID=273540 RepID=A0A9Q0KAI5_9MAGN|nr:hypothetical protein NE237_018782 [Protea cynaroides]